MGLVRAIRRHRQRKVWSEQAPTWRITAERSRQARELERLLTDERAEPCDAYWPVLVFAKNGDQLAGGFIRSDGPASAVCAAMRAGVPRAAKARCIGIPRPLDYRFPPNCPTDTLALDLPALA